CHLDITRHHPVAVDTVAAEAGTADSTGQLRVSIAKWVVGSLKWNTINPSHMLKHSMILVLVI
ncbi:hypothetical protein Tco_1513038, partial [Tanacetum coccineum]